MKGVIVNIRNRGNDASRKAMKKSQNALIAMLEELVSVKDAAEKKRILAEEYGMVMTAELEGRIQIMCNWSESIEESIRESIEESIRESSIRCERLNAIERMIKANATKEQIISYGYTKAEYEEVESSLYVNS